MNGSYRRQGQDGRQPQPLDFSFPLGRGTSIRMKTKLSSALVFLCAAISVVAQGNQDWAVARLEKSPRHGEWVDVKNGSRTVHCWVVYPEVKDKASAVLVIHEIFGLTPWARNAADEVAAAGYIAVAPDLLSGYGPNGGGSKAFKSTDDAIAAIHDLPPEQITGDLNAAADYAKALPAANGKLMVAGFCWGGGETFRYACNRPDLKAAFVFYGTPPPAADMKKIQCPVYGFYGGKDARVSSTIPTAEKEMKAAGKFYQPVVYKGAGHGFMRAGEQPDAESGNTRAHDESWKRLKNLLENL
jgi:carboxymethylenebutenolidase